MARDRSAASSTAPGIPDVEDLELIGRGGSGVVYRGRQPDLEREIAVKVISTPATETSAVARWRREITAMGRLSNHPNIVTVYSWGVTEDGLPYLLMPYLPDGSLQGRLGRDGALPAGEVAALGAKLAGALAAAHHLGVLHRDVKPDNVLLSPYGEPQLADFGIARLLDSTTTATATVHATIRYAAPEVLSGQPAGEQADVYGLGATLFACLMGQAPFAGPGDDSLVGLVGRIATESPGDLRAAGVPDALASVIERAMAKDPETRIATADELRRELEAAAVALQRDGAEERSALTETAAMPLIADPTEAVPVAAAASVVAPAPPRTRPRHRRRNPAPAIAMATVLVLLLAVGIAAYATGGSSNRNGSRTTGAAASVPTTQAVPTTATTTTSTTASTTTSTTAAPPAGDAAAMEHVARSYFDTLAAGNYDGAYAMLSPAFHQVQSQSDFTSYWRTQAPVGVTGAIRVDAAKRQVVVPITTAGQRRDITLTLVPGNGDSWFIDGPRPANG